MIQRRSLEIKTHQERWLVSYADFITLLFAFFVVMYSVSQASEGEYKELVSTLQHAFSLQGTPPLSQSEDLDAAVSAAPSELDVGTVMDQLKQYIAEVPIGQSIQFSGDEEWVEIDIDSNLLFGSGQAALNEDARRFFTTLATLFEPFESAISVSGHTDNIPIANTRFTNNWALSSARAVAVVELLASNGVAPNRLSAIGFGEYQPVADNLTEQGRALNRRVVLRIERQRLASPRAPIAPVASDSLNTEEPTFIQPDVISAPDTNTGAALEPIKLRNGGLLFTRDADSPRATQQE